MVRSMKSATDYTLTPRRLDVLREFLRREQAGLPPPTLRELATHFGNASSHAQLEAVKALVSLGFLRAGKAQTSRSTCLTREGRLKARGALSALDADLDALRAAAGALPLAQRQLLSKEVRKLASRYGSERAPLPARDA